MAKYKRTEEDLVKDLKKQIYFIKSSCQAFDQGYRDEAIRLSTAIRILIHDTKQSKSLLFQLKSKNIPFWNTGRPVTNTNFMPEWPLVRILGEFLPTSAKFNFNPILDDYPIEPKYDPEWMSFNSWWDRPVLSSNYEGVQLSRKSVILTVANKDGGAHIDPKLESDYLTFRNGLSNVKIGYDLEKAGLVLSTKIFDVPGAINTMPSGTLPYDFDDLHIINATIRQIAFEVLYTLENNQKIQTLITRYP